jgi:type 1 fimbria pilin
MELVPGMSWVYKTQVPGIGIRAAYTNTLNPAPENILAVDSSKGSWLVTPGPVVLDYAQSMIYTPVGRFRVQLIAIGPLTQGGTISFPSPTAQMKYGNLVTNRVSFSSSNVQLNIKTCSVSKNLIEVDLPTLPVTSLPAVGSIAGTQKFTLDLRCDQDVKVAYQIDGAAVQGTNAAAGILATQQGTDQAAGVGIQLQQGTTTTPVPLGQVVDSGLKSTSNFEPVNVPLTASYYRTGTSLTGGAVKATATFTMSYQ